LKKKKVQIKKILEQEKKLRATARLIKKLMPHLLEELWGIATGAEVSFNELLAKHCPEVIDAYGCTTVVIKNKKDFFVAHNEDDDDWLGPESYALITYHTNEGLTYTAFVTLGDLPGSTFSWNAARLFFTVDAMVQPQPAQLPNLPRYFQNAALVEQTSLAGAVKFLKKTKAASSDHYLIADMNEKRVVSVEKLSDRISMKNVRGLYIHTNHFLHPKFRSHYKGTENFGTSKDRLAIAEKIFQDDDTPKSVVKKLKTKLKRPLHPDDQVKTWATAVYDINTGQVDIV